MKVYNIHYIAAVDKPVEIVSVKGYESEEQATNAPLMEGAMRLQARGPGDIASLGEAPLAALWAFKAKKGQAAPADIPAALWDMFQPKPKAQKEPESSADGDKDKGLQSGQTDGTSSSPAANSGGKKERTMAKTKKKAAKKTAKKSNGAKGPRGEKTLAVKALLERKSGCSRNDILEKTGWPAVSVPAMAKACGLKLRKEKVKGKPTQYFGS